MDDLATELIVPECEDESSDDEYMEKKRRKRSNLPLAPSLFKETLKDSGFHKTTKTCLQQIREAMLHHQWLEASEFMACYCQSLEDTTASMPPLLSEIIWRMGTEILHHHPNSKLEDYNTFYERMKNYGVKSYLVICLEHALHFLVSGQFEEAKQQLSIAESWRYGKQSASQSQKMKLIQAYSGFLDYFIWCDKKATLSSTDELDAGANQEMHSYFRQSSVNLTEIMKTPGIWDPFVLSYIDMLEFYNDHEGALKVLTDYAYDNSFPPNPNAHVYLYKYLKKHDAPPESLIQNLKILHALVPSHELMQEYCSLLLQSQKPSSLPKALGVSLDLLDYACWRSSLDVWSQVMNILLKLRANEGCSKVVEELMLNRRDWWPTLHFTGFHARKDFVENREIVEIKTFVAEVLCPSASAYCNMVKTLYVPVKTKKKPKSGCKLTSRKNLKLRRKERKLEKMCNQAVTVVDQVF